MKGEKRGIHCVCLAWLLACSLLSGCEEIQIEEASYESRQLIEGWLAYKNQVEDTTQFTETPGNGREEGEKVPYVILEEKQQVVENGVVQPLHMHGFYYGYLSDSLKLVYDEMLESMLKMEGVTLSTLSEEQADLAFRCVLYDHPEIFYVAGYQLNKKTMDQSPVELSFRGEYTLSKEEVVERQKQIDAYTNAFLKSLWEGMDEYEKVKAVYDYIITNTVYCSDAEDNQNICSVFLKGQSVCQGYAEASQYLLFKLGIEAVVVSGTVDGGNRHAWNMVNVNGAYYYMDTTWGDADYRIVDAEGGVSTEHPAPVNYDYFLVTTSQLEKTHQIDSVITMPACIATEDNYYVRENLYFETVNENQIAEAFQRAYAQGQGTVTLKASDDGVFAALKEYMITQQNVFRYTGASSPITYSEDARMCTLCFWLE